ncbi:GNAT family N-acetyltransferase [Metabacillus malikii]|uniref:Ribosomal protein S18 acetylase RimI-like enzyme n=1 Tax=Metabacillus malikii TaxID=1504265 RepID=A0ABT9ZLB0_9BACI|nr:GNAT family N-acetyltransferase [Metabacillus malikii]MDQ0233079.1 ribosomal protein S18 acetylase RimI-like enzyme [Metabacillus malikii]
MRKRAKSKKIQEIDYFEEIESDDTFYFIAGYTNGGAPFGITWEEVIADDLKLRGAVKQDAKKVAELIHIGITDIAEQLTGQTKKENIRKTLAQFFREENNRLSYQNIIVADILNEVAGIIITYPGEDAARLDEPILKRLRKKRRDEEIHFDKEADEKDFYIDTICVDDRYRGNGIGTMLLNEAEKVAVQKGYARVALNVAQSNSSARNLYEHIGYVKEKVIEINKHRYEYMVKPLKDKE